VSEVRPFAPPRNGEGDHAKHGGGADSQGRGRYRPLHHPAAPGGPPPRSGEEQGRRVRHRTLGAPDDTVMRARRLRKELSPPEKMLWSILRKRPGGFKFRRQCPQGPFSLDFACLETRLAIEIDGDAHDRGDRPERDERRDSVVERMGFFTMRIPAAEVFRNLEGVVTGIVDLCRTRGPLHRRSGGPPPRTGEEFA
jgi:very-short-patch-repair endonuclease